MIKVVKKKRETATNLLKRFKRKLQKSGHILRFKETQFKKRNPSVAKKKKDALKKVGRAKKINKLYKLGKWN